MWKLSLAEWQSYRVISIGTFDISLSSLLFEMIRKAVYLSGFHYLYLYLAVKTYWIKIKLLISMTNHNEMASFEFCLDEKKKNFRNWAYDVWRKKKQFHRKSREEALHIIQQPETKPSVTVLDVNWMMIVQ